MEKLLLNQKQAAETLGVSTKTISRSGLEPVETRGSHKMFTLEQLINFEADRRAIDLVTADNQTDLEPGSVAYANWRKTMAQALKIERENEIAEGEVIPVDFATFALAKISNEISGILDSLPLHLKRRHPEISSRGLATIKKEIIKTMNIMATISEKSLPGIVEEYNQKMSKEPF